MVQAATYGKAILVMCAIGLGLSGYSYIVKTKKTEDAKYKSICDFNEHMSCSRVLTSEYAYGFGLIRPILGEDSALNVANSVYGATFFVTVASLSLLQKAWTAKVQVGLGIVANIFTVYLSFLLYFVLKDFCLLCVSTYVVNFINLVLAYLRLRALTPKQAGKQKGQQKSQKGQNKQKQNEKQKSPQPEKKKSDKQKSPQADKQKQNNQKQNQNQQKQSPKQNQNQNQQKQSPKQNQNQQKQSPNQKQNQNQQNGKVKNQQNDKQKSPKTPNSKKKNN